MSTWLVNRDVRTLIIDYATASPRRGNASGVFVFRGKAVHLAPGPELPGTGPGQESERDAASRHDRLGAVCDRRA